MGTVTFRDSPCTNIVHLSTSTMKFAISLVVLALVAGINAAPGGPPLGFFENPANGLGTVAAIQKSIVNIGYGAEDLEKMEAKLQPLTTDTSVGDAETAITTAMDKSDLANAFVHP